MSLARMDKDTVIDIIAASVSFIPFYGDYIGNGITVVKGFRKLFKDASKATQIIEKIQAGVHCGDLSEEDAKSVCAAIQGVLRDKKTDLQKIARDNEMMQNLKNNIFKASDHRKNAESQYQKFISEAVECMFSPEILPLFADCDQIAVENLREIRVLLESCNLISERLYHLETRMTDIEQNKSAPKKQSKPDNQEYLNRIYEPLFLEEDDSKVTLASMYVSPHISGKQDTAADCIMTWFGKNSINKCMLLFGSAGVGKSTLVSKIIADACCATDDREYHLRQDQVLAVAQNADYWFIKWTNINSLKDLQGANSLNREMAAFKNSRVYVCDTDKTHFFDRIPFHPEVLLREFAAIMHPELFPGFRNQMYHHID